MHGSALDVLNCVALLDRQTDFGKQIASRGDKNAAFV